MDNFQHTLFKLLQAISMAKESRQFGIHYNYTHGSVKSTCLFTSNSINC